MSTVNATRTEPGSDQHKARRGPPRPNGGRTSGQLVLAAATGDDSAWDELVTRHVGLLWTVARNHGLSTSDAADVVQTTWLRLAENLGRLRDPEAVASWLGTTARNVSLGILRSQSREDPTDTMTSTLLLACPDRAPGPEQTTIAKDLAHQVRTALARLPERERQLLTLLALRRKTPYEEIAAALDMPVGSIGPTRARALNRLRAQLAELGVRSW